MGERARGSGSGGAAAAGRGGLLRSGLVVSALTLVSRVSGLVRDWIIAVSFGASPLMDAFWVAFRIPNLLRRLFGEGGFAKGFVPVFTEYRETREPAELRALLARVIGTLGALLLALCSLIVAAAPLVVLLFAWGFADEPDRWTAAIDMLRLTAPYLFFISLVAAAGGALNSLGRFAVPALTPVFLNLCMIGAALLLAPRLAVPEYALAWAVLLAGAVQLSFQLPFLARAGLLARPRWGWRDPGVRRIGRLMVPALVGAGAYQINQLVNTALASLLVSSSVSWLYYADRLLEFPLGLVGIALGTVILPRLAALHTRGAVGELGHTLAWALRVAVWTGLPAALLLGLLAGPMLSTLFEYGAFRPLDRAMAAAALQVLALALPAYLLINVLNPVFYARQAPAVPVRIGVIAMAVNMAIGAALVGWALHSGATRAHVGLSAAVVASSWLQVVLLLRALARAELSLPWASWVTALRPAALGALALSAAVLWLTPAMDWWAAASAVERVLRLAVIMAAGAFAWVLALWLGGARPAQLSA